MKKLKALRKTISLLLTIVLMLSSFVVTHANPYDVSIQFCDDEHATPNGEIQLDNSGAAEVSDYNIVTATANRFTLTNNVSNASIHPSGANVLIRNITYIGALTANAGFARPASITVMRGTTNITSSVTYNRITGVITIPAAQVTGAITISGTATANSFTLINTSDSPPSGVVGEEYSYSISTADDMPTTWQLARGSSLPVGLELSDDGIISGIPTISGTFEFIVWADNGTEMELSITIEE